MNRRFLISFFVAGSLLLGHTSCAWACDWEWGKLIKSLFSDKPVQQQDPADFHRGHAQEEQPDISIPPLPEQTGEQEPQLYSNPNEKAFNEMITGLENIAGVASQKGESGLEGIPTQPHRPTDSANKVRWAPPPPGFLTADTFNYLIYRQTHPVTETIKKVLDNIHGNLMLDLTPFTVVLKPNKILVMLFEEKRSYMDFTKLPSWSGASSDLKADSMYVIETNSFYPLSVHELTHLYFDGYFLPTISPLWLSEGMAVYMQVHASKKKPAWIDQGMREILAGHIIPLETLTQTEDISSYSTEKAGLYYTQAYSVVDYLLNTRSRDEFYKFCTELKNKAPMHQALYRAYGMPFNKVSALENVWLHDLQKAYREGKILQTPPPSAMVPPATKQATGKTTKINQLQMVPTNSYQGGF